MTILYLSHRLPFPPNKGEKIRTFHQIRQLGSKHILHLCAFADNLSELAQTVHLKKYCASVDVVHRKSIAIMPFSAAAFVRGKPLSVRLFYQKALLKLVRRKLAMERVDCVVVSCSSMAQYVAGISDIPTVIDFIDVDSEKWLEYAQRTSFPLSALYKREAELLAKYEEKLILAFDHSIISSEAEAQILRTRVKDRPITVISNGVDLEYFSLAEAESSMKSRLTIVFIGVMDYFPNVDAVQFFCHEIFPLVRKSMPNAQFCIVGRNPTRQVRELGKQINVVVTGSVLDIRPYLGHATVSVAPFRLARGIQNKILESMAMGIPVVGTTVAFKGILATERDGIRIADDPNSFAQYVTAFLQGDRTLRREAGFQARRYVERYHRWEDQGAKLEGLLHEVVGSDARANFPEPKSVELHET